MNDNSQVSLSLSLCRLARYRGWGKHVHASAGHLKDIDSECARIYLKIDCLQLSVQNSSKRIKFSPVAPAYILTATGNPYQFL